MVKDRKETENQVVNHLSRLDDETLLKLCDKAEISDVFPNEEVLATFMILFFGLPTLIIIWQEIWFPRICLSIKGLIL